jgi:hypothetical protein
LALFVRLPYFYSNTEKPLTAATFKAKKLQRKLQDSAYYFFFLKESNFFFFSYFFLSPQFQRR